MHDLHLHAKYLDTHTSHDAAAFPRARCTAVSNTESDGVPRREDLERRNGFEWVVVVYGDERRWTGCSFVGALLRCIYLPA